MVKRRLFALPGNRRNIGGAVKQITTAAGQSIPATGTMKNPIGLLADAISTMPSSDQELLKNVIKTAAKAAGKNIANRMKLKTNKAGIPLNKPYKDTSGLLTKSYTYWGKVPKLVPNLDVARRYGTFKFIASSVIDLGSSYGTQNVTNVFARDQTVNCGPLLYEYLSAIKSDYWKNHLCQPIQSTVRLNLTNNDVAPAIISIYEVVAANDGDLTPKEVWERKLLQQTNVTGTQEVTDLDNSPEFAPGFRSNYKIFRKTTISLGPGDVHEHRARYAGFNETSVDRFFTQQTQSSTPAVGNFKYIIKGYTVFLMLVIKGIPVRDTSNNVSTSTPIITWTGSIWTRLCIREQYVPVYKETGTFGTLTAANLQIREKDGDVVTGDQIATLEN